jgi:ankyrin repeat protein
MKSHRFAILLTLFAQLGARAQTDRADGFYRAIRNNDPASLKALLRTLDVNSRDERGETPLMYAVAFGNAEAMKSILDAGADVNAKNAFDATALIWAAGDPVKSRMLIERGADVNAKSRQGPNASNGGGQAGWRE